MLDKSFYFHRLKDILDMEYMMKIKNIKNIIVKDLLKH